MLNLDLSRLRATPLSERNPSTPTSTASKQAPLTSRRSGAMATPALQRLGVQLAPTHDCVQCGPVDFTINHAGKTTCGDCGATAVPIRPLDKSAASGALEPARDEENMQPLDENRATPSGAGLVMRKATPTSSAQRSRKLFHSAGDNSFDSPASQMHPAPRAPSALATPAAQEAPSVSYAGEDEDGENREGSSRSVRCGLKLDGHFLLCRASRPPMTDGFYKVSVTDIATGVETEFISCAAEQSAFEYWPKVDFSALLTMHYDASPKRAPFVWRATLSSTAKKLKQMGSPRLLG